jgi:hypothetical protein
MWKPARGKLDAHKIRSGGRAYGDRPLQVAVRKDRSRASAQAGFISPSREHHFVDGRVPSIEGKKSELFRPTLYTLHSSLVPFPEPKPQQTGTGLLIRFGEVATTSGSTNLRRSRTHGTVKFIARRSKGAGFSLLRWLISQLRIAVQSLVRCCQQRFPQPTRSSGL